MYKIIIISFLLILSYSFSIVDNDKASINQVITLHKKDSFLTKKLSLKLSKAFQIDNYQGIIFPNDTYLNIKQVVNSNCILLWANSSSDGYNGLIVVNKDKNIYLEFKSQNADDSLCYSMINKVKDINGDNQNDYVVLNFARMGMGKTEFVYLLSKQQSFILYSFIASGFYYWERNDNEIYPGKIIDNTLIMVFDKHIAGNKGGYCYFPEVKCYTFSKETIKPTKKINSGIKRMIKSFYQNNKDSLNLFSENDKEVAFLKSKVNTEIKNVLAGLKIKYLD